MWKAAVLALCWGSAAGAGNSDVPRLADGTVDVAAVISSFRAIGRAEAGPAPILYFDGSILGEPFTASYPREVDTDPFILSIRSADLSGHKAYLATVLLIELTCLHVQLRPAEVSWREKSVKVADGWDIEVSCLPKAGWQGS